MKGFCFYCERRKICFSLYTLLQPMFHPLHWRIPFHTGVTHLGDLQARSRLMTNVFVGHLLDLISCFLFGKTHKYIDSDLHLPFAGKKSPANPSSCDGNIANVGDRGTTNVRFFYV